MTTIEILLKEYDSLRAEVLERIKIAFSHLGYFGAVVAFAFPATDKLCEYERILAQGLAVFGAFLLAYISVINWFWVSRLASHLKQLEEKINNESISQGGSALLTWEGIVRKISRWVLLPPKQYPPSKHAQQVAPGDAAKRRA
jgi:hypothetical protein